MAEYEATRGMPAESGVVSGVASDVTLVNRWLLRERADEVRGMLDESLSREIGNRLNNNSG
ncbi:hypothetical protein [Nonomuraea harbinensis]|uniref:Uncharacterized protein n=1 Tax=Nonomuraea harbinensis TaxID=1286938 RepID=A0ABW1BRP4_9ACTN|nr:hypothetical protein [Nonomuraea harbinensis]